MIHQGTVIPQADHWSLRILRYAILLALLVVPSLFNPFVEFGFEPPKALALRTLALGMGTLLVVFGRNLTLSSRPSLNQWLLTTIGIYAGAQLVSTVQSQHVAISLWGRAYNLHGIATTFSLLLIAITIGLCIQGSQQTKTIAIAAVIGSIPVCLYGLSQVAGLDTFIWKIDSLSPMLSTVGRSNFVASYLAILLPFTIYAISFSQVGLRIILIVLFLLQLLTLILSQARAGWLAALTGITVLVAVPLLTRRHYRRALRICLGLVIIGGVFILTFQTVRSTTMPVTYGWHSYTELRQISATRRLTIWSKSLQVAADAGLSGYGPEAFLAQFNTRFPPGTLFAGSTVSFDDPHNIFLEQAINGGLLGLLAFAAVIGLSGLICFQQIRSRHALNFKPNLPLVLLAALAAWLVQALLTPNILVTDLLLWVVVGLTAGLSLPNGLKEAKASVVSAETTPFHWRKALANVNLSALILLTIAIALGFMLRSYNVATWMRFTGDEARDIYAAYGIIEGHHLPTQGPKVHIGFGHLGPAYYYMLAAPLALLRGNPAAAVWLTVVFDAAAIILLYLLVKQWRNARTALIAAALYAVSFQLVFYARWGWHPSLVPFFALAIIYCCMRIARGDAQLLPLLGLSVAVGLQLHLSIVVLFVPIAIALWQGRRSLSLPLTAFACIVAAYSFVPLLVHDLANDYENLRGVAGLLDYKSAEIWTNPILYLIDSLQVISSAEIVHKSITLMPGRSVLRWLNLALFLPALLVWWRGCHSGSKHNLILLTWATAPLVAMIFYSGFRPDYYLITWFAVPLVLLAAMLDWLLSQKQRWLQLSAVTGFMALVAINLLATHAYYNFLAARTTDYSFYLGATLETKQQVAAEVLSHVADKPFELHIATWAWPTHQPWNYVLTNADLTITDRWLHESATGDSGPYTQHWLDPTTIFTTNQTELDPSFSILIKEPDTLPMPDDLSIVEQLAIVNNIGIYIVADKSP